ncbi:MAG: low molecular weight protein-tyrosine-phosphatase [Prevotella sp.]
MKKGKIRILFVCLGNICRSPAAEAVLSFKLSQAGIGKDKVEVDSAGIGSWHVGELPDRRMRTHGASRGLDICSRARQVVPSDFHRFDYIIGMDSDNVRALRSMAKTPDETAKIHYASEYMSHQTSFTSVLDPYYGGDREFELALDLIEEVCQGIMDMLFKE